MTHVDRTEPTVIGYRAAFVLTHAERRALTGTARPPRWYTPTPASHDSLAPADTRTD